MVLVFTKRLKQDGAGLESVPVQFRRLVAAVSWRGFWLWKAVGKPENIMAHLG